jgi:hypothetical protein
MYVPQSRRVAVNVWVFQGQPEVPNGDLTVT